MEERDVLLGYKPLRSRRQRLATAFLYTATSALVLCNLVGLLGRYFVVADIFNHFVHLYGAAAFLLFLSALFRRAWIPVTLALVVVVIALVRVAPFYMPSAHAAANTTGKPITILTANTNYENRNFPPVMDLIHAWNTPDVIVFPECNDRWRQALMPIAPEYPFVLHTGISAGRYGVSVYSRYPFEPLEIAKWPGLRHRILAVRVHHPAGDFTFVGAHPRSVHSSTGLHVADMHLLADCIAELPAPIVLAGDLNSTPWSPNMQRVQTAADLTDARCGRGLMPTWPDAPIHFPFLMLDGVFAGPEFAINALEVGPTLASDHLPMLATLHLRAE